MSTVPLPTIHHPTTLADFLHWILRSHSSRSSTLVLVCSARAPFQRQLHASITARTPATASGLDAAPDDHPPPAGPDEGAPVESQVEHGAAAAPRSHPHPLLSQTLQALAAARIVRLAFVDSLPALRAYLTTLPGPKPGNAEVHVGVHGRGRALLALVNPLALHAAAGELSAQALGMSVGLAVEAAERLGAAFVGVECGEADADAHGYGHSWEGDHAGLGSEVLNEDVTEERLRNEVETLDAEADPEVDGMRYEQGVSHRNGTRQLENPWEQQIPILSASTKTFGGDKAWSDRSVKVRDVVGRWCTFSEPLGWPE